MKFPYTWFIGYKPKAGGKRRPRMILMSQALKAHASSEPPPPKKKKWIQKIKGGGEVMVSFYFISTRRIMLCVIHYRGVFALSRREIRLKKPTEYALPFARMFPENYLLKNSWGGGGGGRLLVRPTTIYIVPVITDVVSLPIVGNIRNDHFIFLLSRVYLRKITSLSKEEVIYRHCLYAVSQVLKTFRTVWHTGLMSIRSKTKTSWEFF